MILSDGVVRVVSRTQFGDREYFDLRYGIVRFSASAPAGLVDAAIVANSSVRVTTREGAICDEYILQAPILIVSMEPAHLSASKTRRSLRGMVDDRSAIVPAAL